MRRIAPNPALLKVAVALAFAAASLPAQQPATPPAPAQTQPSNQPHAPAPAAPQVASSQGMSQPGAQGQLHEAIVPPVPVPPGPIAPNGIKPAPPTPIAVKKVELQENDPWNPEWDALIEENLPPDLLSPKVAHAVKPFCPRFNLLPEADKRSFWAYFFQALAGAEAGLKPTSDVRHTDPSVAIVDPITHHITRQEGLLQLKYQDSQRYSCDFDWDNDKNLPTHDPGKTILNPRNNLLCGINILQNQLINLHQPLLTRKSYWATLHPGTFSYAVFARQMANLPEACGQRTVRHRRWHLLTSARETSVVQTPTASSSFQDHR